MRALEATLFWYFTSKDEIFTSILFEGIDFMWRGIEAIRAADLEPGKKLARVWKLFAEAHPEHPEYYHVYCSPRAPLRSPSSRPSCWCRWSRTRWPPSLWSRPGESATVAGSQRR